MKCVTGPNVYSARMARVNITVPDDISSQAKAAGLNVSRLSTAALTGELDRIAKVAELDRYLHELEVEFGPVSVEEQDAARQWADEVFGAAAPSARRGDARTG